MIKLNKIYTKTGDGGDTALGDGKRVLKDSLRVSAYGNVDELNASIGVITLYANAELKRKLKNIQNDLFDIGADLCVPISENNIQYAKSPYAATKIGADQIAQSYYSSFDLPVTIIRPFNTFGPRQSLRAIIPTIITQILHQKKYIKLGNTFSTRNFNYISDTVDGFMSVIGKNKIFGEIINIGSNYDISINDTVKLISKLMDRKINIIKDEQRKRPRKSEVDRIKSIRFKGKKTFKMAAKI